MSTTNLHHENPSKPSRLVEKLLELSTREAEIQHVETLSPHFRLITLAGAQLIGAHWTPGDILQLILSGSSLFGPWELRAYTPLHFDPIAGTAQILAFVPGHGPGSAWVASAQVGTRCRFVGPRTALPLPKTQRPLLFFGDETSFSTALALREAASDSPDLRFFFEVSSALESYAVFDRFALRRGLSILARGGSNDPHFPELERQILERFRAEPETYAILTGKAPSIQRLQRSLRAAGVPRRQMRNLAYWTPGKKGL